MNNLQYMDIDLEEIRARAEEYYRSGNFYCSEAIVRTIIESFDSTIDLSVVKAASGFPVGIGGSGCTCGAISGGVIAIGLFFGRSEGKDPAVNKAMELSAQLYKKFTNAHKISCCKILVKGLELGSDKHMQQCISLTGEMAYETAKIISENLSR